MAKLSDITAAALLQILSAYSLTKGVLAINAASAATVKTTNAISYAVNGVLYSKAILAAQSIAVTHDFQVAPSLGYVQPAGTTAYYTLGVNAAGTVSVSQSSFLGQKYAADPTLGVGAAAMVGVSFIGNGLPADVPAGYAPFGMVKIVTAGAATFTAGTTALDAANITATYFDLSVVPAGAL